MIARFAAAVALGVGLLAGCGPAAPDQATPTGGAARAFEPEALRFAGADLVLVSMDTLRADRLGCYGYERGTSPNIDAFAESAVLFEEVFSNSPKTASSHMSLFTSRLPTVHKVRNQSARLDLTSPVLASNRPTLAQLLRRAGYLTAAFTGGANVVAEVGFKRGFGKNFHSGNLAFEELVPQLAGTYKQMVAQPSPGFLFGHSFQVHGPYLPPAELQERFVREESPRLAERVKAYTGLPRHQQWAVMNREGMFGQPTYWDGKEDWGAAEGAYLSDLYDAGIAHMDASMGEFFARLEKNGAYENAIIVLLSDHGEEFFEHGDFEHDGVHREHLHVPLIVRLPGGHLGGTRVRGMAQLLDVMPTLLELLGLEAPDDLEGLSHVAALEAGRVEQERPVVSEHVMFLPQGRYLAALRTRAGLSVFDAEHGELSGYDLRADPAELTDVHGQDPGVTALAAQLKGVLINATERREFLDEEDAGGTLGQELTDAAAQADRSKELASMGYFAGDTPDTEIPEELRDSFPLGAWPEDG